jgi:dGTPase
MINHLVSDLIDASAARLKASGVRSIAEVRTHSKALIGFSDATRAANHELKTFLREQLYKHYKVRRMTAKARRIVRDLFDVFFNDPALMPDEHEARTRLELVQGPAGRARAVADYIAGMTDRYAILEHSRLFDPSERT